TRLSPRDTHIPEFAEAAVPAQMAQGSAFSRGAQSGEVGSGSPSDCATHKIEQDSLAPARPVRLFARPEVIEALAEVPDGPPVRFKWRYITHDVVAVEGPERIAMQWWRDDAGR